MSKLVSFFTLVFVASCSSATSSTNPTSATKQTDSSWIWSGSFVEGNKFYATGFGRGKDAPLAEREQKAEAAARENVLALVADFAKQHGAKIDESALTKSVGIVESHVFDDQRVVKFAELELDAVLPIDEPLRAELTKFAAQHPRGTSVRPAWISGEAKRFHGVGSATGINNPALARSTAGSRARAKVGDEFQRTIAFLFKDLSNPVEIAPEVENWDAMQRAYAAAMLQETEIRDYWYDVVGDEHWALAVLDLRDPKMREACRRVNPNVDDKTIDAFVDRILSVGQNATQIQ